MASNKLAQAARRTFAMGPSVKNLLTQYNLDPRQIVSTGPHQILLKSDVLSYIRQKNLVQSRGTTQKTTSSAYSSNSHLSETKTPKSSSSNAKIFQKETVIHISDESILKSKYARRRLTELEIDVINNGGRL